MQGSAHYRPRKEEKACENFALPVKDREKKVFSPYQGLSSALRYRNDSVHKKGVLGRSNSQKQHS